MDAAALTSLVIGIITPLLPYLSSAGTAIAGKVGEAVYEEGKHLFEAMRTRFAKEADGGKASLALDTFVSDPDYRSVVEKKLFSILQADPDFAQQLHQIIKSGPRQSLTIEEEAEARHIRMTNTLGTGTQDITGGKRAKIEDVEMNIKPE